MMNIGTIGTGSIVATMIENFHKTDIFQCTAVYSRKEKTGQTFADRFGIKKIYTDLESMYQDPEIDLIYVASPNSLHYAHVKQALEMGKHVICEKPFTVSFEETLELIRLAKEKHLFLFEAITTIYSPVFQCIQEHLTDIGTLQMVSATFCQYSSRYDAFLAGAVPNVFNPDFAGGSLMDINYYNLYFVVSLFGKPDSVNYMPHKAENGIDTFGILNLQYPHLLCQCIGSKASNADNGIQIIGEKGYIHATASAGYLKEVKITCSGKEDLTFSVPECPWYYETRGIASIVAANDYESCYETLLHSASVMETLVKARRSGGLSF